MVDYNKAIAQYLKDRPLDWIVATICGLSIMLGFVLLVLGINGSIELEVGTKTLNGKLVNASPGIVMAAFGFIVLGIQVWRGKKKVTMKDFKLGSLELHESGPVLILSDRLAIRLTRPTDRDLLKRGDHWYGQPFDSMFEELSQTPLDRDKRAPVSDTWPVRIENTIVPLVTAWSESASHKDKDLHKDRSGRVVEIHVGEGYINSGEFEKGHTCHKYSGKLVGDEVRLVLSFFYKLAECNRE